jgi:FkbM family methyltransferase
MSSSTVSTNLDGSLEDWLESQIARHASFFQARPLLLDVGAYHGDFSRRFAGAQQSPFLQAILFEPNPENFSVLQETFSADKRFRLEARACADHSGGAKLYCEGERYTGSLLAYQNERPGPRTEHTVTVTTVDELLSAEEFSKPPGLIKIDTQGNDLRVLQGARRTLQNSRPWVVVEMLATPRFVNQATPLEIMQFLEGEQYFLAAMFNEFYTASGWLAWYDACFVPRELFSMVVTANDARPTVAEAGVAKGGKGVLGKGLRRLLRAG